MKKGIRLGISSMSNSHSHVSQSKEIKKSFTRSSICSSLSALSASDLDDMFETNLQLLHDFEENEKFTNVKPQHFQSSLNVFVSTNNSQKMSTVSKHNTLSSKKEFCNQRTPNIYSSYETLYDDIICKKEVYDKVKDWECMSEPILDTSKGSIEDYLKLGSVISLNSDRTLKSLSSDNSSKVSSINSDDQNLEINKSNQSLPTFLPMSNEVHMHTKLRFRPDILLPRPVTYHQGESAGYYYSNKFLSNISSNSNENKRIRKEGTYTPANIIISRSIKNQLVTSHKSKSSIFINNNMPNSRESEQQVNSSISSRNIPININNNNNIVNNHIVSIPRALSSHLINNGTVISPVPPPRNKMKSVGGIISENYHQETMQTISEVTVQGPVKSCINLNIDPHARNIKSNGLKFHLQSQNYGKNSSNSNNRVKDVINTKSTDIPKKL